MFRPGLVSHLTTSNISYKPMITFAANRPHVGNYIDVLPCYTVDCVQFPPSVGIAANYNYIGPISPPQAPLYPYDIVPLPSPPVPLYDKLTPPRNRHLVGTANREFQAFEYTPLGSDGQSIPDMANETSSDDSVKALSPPHNCEFHDNQARSCLQRRGIKRHLDSSPHTSSNTNRSRSSTPTLSPSKRQKSPGNTKGYSKNHRSSSFPRWSKTEWDKLSLEIWEYYMKHRQTREMYNMKLQLRERLHALLRTQYPYCGLYAVGSSMNGLGSQNSDMDLCFMVSKEEIDQRREAKEILQHIKIMLSMTGIANSPQLIHAKVPILKFRDTLTGIEIDLNVNNSVGIRNTCLLACYAKLDWRVPPLILVIKKWAKEHGINDAKMQTLSSYSLVMMVLHYLQAACNPPVLPSLQELEPSMFNPTADIQTLSLGDKIPSFVSQNKKTLGELLLGFLHYYNNVFDFKKSAISVRLGRVIPKHEVMFHKSPKNTMDQWKFLCIEEPFDRTNTARAVYNELPFKKILKVFRVSWYVLRDTKSLRSLIFSRGGKS